MYAAAVRSPHFKALPAASRRALHHVVSFEFNLSFKTEFLNKIA